MRASRLGAPGRLGAWSPGPCPLVAWKNVCHLQWHSQGGGQRDHAPPGSQGSLFYRGPWLTQWALGDAKAPAADPLTQLSSYTLAKRAPILEPWGPIETRGPVGWDGSNLGPTVCKQNQCVPTVGLTLYRFEGARIGSTVDLRGPYRFEEALKCPERVLSLSKRALRRHDWASASARGLLSV